MKKILTKLVVFIENIEADYPRVHKIFSTAHGCYKKSERYILNKKGSFEDMCEAIAKPSAMYAFSVIVFSEIYRGLEVKNPDVEFSLELASNMFFYATLFGIGLVFISATWLITSFTGWYWPIFIETMERETKRPLVDFITFVLITLFSLFLLYGYGLAIWGISTLVLYR